MEMAAWYLRSHSRSWKTRAFIWRSMRTPAVLRGAGRRAARLCHRGAACGGTTSLPTCRRSSAHGSTRPTRGARHGNSMRRAARCRDCAGRRTPSSLPSVPRRTALVSGEAAAATRRASLARQPPRPRLAPTTAMRVRRRGAASRCRTARSESAVMGWTYLRIWYPAWTRQSPPSQSGSVDRC